MGRKAKGEHGSNRNRSRSSQPSPETIARERVASTGPAADKGGHEGGRKGRRQGGRKGFPVVLGLVLSGAAIALVAVYWNGWGQSSTRRATGFSRPDPGLNYLPRKRVDDSGYSSIIQIVEPWPRDATPRQIGDHFRGAAEREVAKLDRQLAETGATAAQKVGWEFEKANFLNFDGQVEAAYAALGRARVICDEDPAVAADQLYTIIFYQGVAALRKGENDNCIMCRGETSCILPISREAQHTNPEGSQLAIAHFLEYLDRFPDDPEVWWLLNLAHMTLGEYPDKVEPKYLMPIDHFLKQDLKPGVFRDVGALVGLNRFNQAGGGIMDDFDGDNLLDVIVSSFDAKQVMGYFRNQGDGKFVEQTEEAGLTEQFGGLYCVQTDYNNDGYLDVLVVRGAWLTDELAMRPSLLRNEGGGKFTDVTLEAGLAEPLNAITAAWADYDNDGFLDVFIGGEQQANRLYRNRGDGTFEDRAGEAGVAGTPEAACKGATWLDFDNDGDQDLFLNHLSGEGARLFRNDGRGHFDEVTQSLRISGPRYGFACWSWDFDNDGWLDIFATSYDRSLNDLALDLLGLKHQREPGRLYRNLQGRGFEEVATAVGVAGCFATMGCNFGDLNNDGWLDFYLGTGDPRISTLVPNRMFFNQDGREFVDVTTATRTGNLQKGHSVACGDWDNDGNVDLFIQMGGAIDGDKYHNILFQNPGSEHAWIALKLIGKKSNRAAIGTRIRIVTAGENPQTIHRVIGSGSSFGANPLLQTIGLGAASGIAELEIKWPTSQTRQVFRNVPVGKLLEIEEFAEDYEVRDRPVLHVPQN